jgi:hypothetical protein
MGSRGPGAPTPAQILEAPRTPVHGRAARCLLPGPTTREGHEDGAPPPPASRPGRVGRLRTDGPPSDPTSSRRARCRRHPREPSPAKTAGDRRGGAAKEHRRLPTSPAWEGPAPGRGRAAAASTPGFARRHPPAAATGEGGGGGGSSG